MVADFGLASIQNHLISSATKHHEDSQQSGGTLRWMAPELLDGELPKKSADLYSFAITAWELYSSVIPFSTVLDSLLPYVVGVRKKRPLQPTLMNDELWTIICMCWDPDPQKRPVFSVLHEKLKNFSGQGTVVLSL